MMPMAGQDAAIDAATIEWEPDVGAPTVEREHLSALVREEHRAVAAVHDKPPFGS
jgi:hypothetical protein